VLLQDSNVMKSFKPVVSKKKLQPSPPFWSKAQSWFTLPLIWLKSLKYSPKNLLQSTRPLILW